MKSTSSEYQMLSQPGRWVSRARPTAAPFGRERPLGRPAGIVVLVPADRARGWARVLVEVLGARFGLPTEWRRVPGLKSQAGIPSEDIERRLLGPAQHDHSAWIQTAGAASSEDIDVWPQRLVVNATGHDPVALPQAIRQATIISPTFHGQYGVEALAIPLCLGEPPHLGVAASCGEATHALYGAWLSAMDRTRLHGALDVILGRTITLLGGALNHLIDGSPLPDLAPAPAPRPIPAPPEFWMRRFLATGLPRLSRQLGLREAWRVGVRRLQAEDAPARLDLDPATFHILQNPPGHFYADPFLLRHEGTTALFFEDYDFRLGRAHISRVVLGEDGPTGPPHDTLTRPYHLSYPFVFVHDGAALMIPETSANRTIELYEAQAFPDQWRLRSVLIDNIEANDSTLHHDENTGLWWIFSAVSEFGSSTHDSLWIFFSERLEGPWRPHPGNPVKLDPASSRPAGPLLRWEGRLFRPAQDCRRAYGAGLVWCEITQLEPHAFHEEPMAPGPDAPPCFPVHTYGRAAGHEVADFKMQRWRLLA